MPFESKESIRRVHSIVDQISASVSLRESQSANLNLENNSLILLKWMQKPSSKSFESTRRRFNGLHMNWETRIRNPLRVWVGVRDQFRRQPSCKIFASGHKKKASPSYWDCLFGKIRIRLVYETTFANANFSHKWPSSIARHESLATWK